MEDNYKEGQDGPILVYPIVRGIGPKIWNLCLLERELCEKLDKMEEDERLNSPMRRESGGEDDDPDGVSKVEIELREPESSACENRDPFTGDTM